MPGAEATAEDEIGSRGRPFGSKTIIDILDWLSESAQTFGTQPRERWAFPYPDAPLFVSFQVHYGILGPDSAAVRYTTTTSCPSSTARGLARARPGFLGLNDVTPAVKVEQTQTASQHALVDGGYSSPHGLESSLFAGLSSQKAPLAPRGRQSREHS
jgi:hypothetical protein